MIKLTHFNGFHWGCSWRGEDLFFDQFSASRLIFHDVAGEYLVKIDHKPDDSWQSRQTAKEIEFWETLGEDREFFAEILDYGRTEEGFYWLRQKWYEPDEIEFLDSKNKQVLQDLIFKYNLWDIDLEFIDGTGNWMLHKGEVLIYDWGGYV